MLVEGAAQRKTACADGLTLGLRSRFVCELEKWSCDRFTTRVSGMLQIAQKILLCGMLLKNRHKMPAAKNHIMYVHRSFCGSENTPKRCRSLSLCSMVIPGACSVFLAEPAPFGACQTFLDAMTMANNAHNLDGLECHRPSCRNGAMVDQRGKTT